MEAIAALPLDIQGRVAALTLDSNGQEIHDFAKRMALTSIIPYSETLLVAEDFFKSGFTVETAERRSRETGRSLIGAAVLMLEAERLSLRIDERFRAAAGQSVFRSLS